jgi:2-polyprenyl-3-methyl-5-hydroxy-6-metoxy-1,4-benzoquinol methylase
MLSVHPQPTCIACGTHGKSLYTQLSDRLFNAPGLWDMDQCINRQCGTLWLNPYPNEELIPSFYIGYHTHDNAPILLENKPALQSFMDRLKNGYLYTQYGYGIPSKLNWVFNLISYAYPGWQDARGSNHFYLPNVTSGKFLDVGCGSGGALASMKKRGWEVFGIDFDEEAISVARTRNLACSTGGLLDQKFPSESFDAILLSHVIEHLSNPAEIIAECYRILKSEGRLIMITPNAGSWSRKLFKENWRGLEVPRHLQIFTPPSLKHIASRSHFSTINAFSSPHGELFFIRESRQLPRKKRGEGLLTTKKLSSRVVEHLVLFVFGWINIFIPHKMGMTVVICKK